jgi:hypothetical protein
LVTTCFNLLVFQDLGAILHATTTSTVNETPADERNEMERYLANEFKTEPGSTPVDVLQEWKRLEPKFPTVARMAKDVLAVPLAGVGVERSFNYARDVCHYRRGKLHADTIKKIMLVKHAHQKEMIDEIISSEAELKKEMEDDADDSKHKKYIATAEEKLAQQCHFDYQERAREVARETSSAGSRRGRGGRPVRGKKR